MKKKLMSILLVISMLFSQTIVYAEVYDTSMQEDDLDDQTFVSEENNTQTIDNQNVADENEEGSGTISVQEKDNTIVESNQEIFEEDSFSAMQSEEDIILKSDILGAYEGTYDGVYNGTNITRNLRVDISNCKDNGGIGGYVTIDSGDNGKYYFEGTLDFESGEIQFQGSEWIDNPSNFDFVTFDGNVNIDENSITGIVDSDSNRIFNLSKISKEYTSYEVDFKNMTKDFTGEYDGVSGSTVVRRNIEIHIQDVSDFGEISGTAIISPSEKSDSSYGANGSYYFNGTLHKNTGKIEMQGYEWIDYPVQYDNFTFISFSGYLDVNEDIIIGTTENGIWTMEAIDFSDLNTNSGFVLGTDNNNFVHASSSSWDGAGFVGVTNYTIDDEYFNKLTANSKKSEKNKIKKKMKQKWDGSCYGIAMSMGLLYEDYIDISDLTDESSVKNYHSLSYPCDNEKLLNMINYYQLSQNLENGGKKTSAVSAAYNNGCFTGLVNWMCSYDSLSVFLKKLVNYSSTDHVELLGFSTSDGGHAVLVTGCEYDEDAKQYKVQIYDENSVLSSTSKGEFSYMTIESDFSAFSYQDSNGDTINNKTYVSIYFLDWDALGNIVSKAKKTSSDHAKLDFLLGDDFKAVNAEGKYIEYSNDEFTGDMSIYDISTVDSDEGVHIIIETDASDYVELSNLASNIDVEFYNDNNYLALQSENLENAKLTLGEGIELQGDSYSFTAYVGMDELNDNEDGLLSVSADANSDATITKQDNELEVKADDSLENIITTDYAGVKTDEKKHDSTDNLNVMPGTAKGKSSSSILLEDKTVTFSGKNISIGKATVTGSAGSVEYSYYSDSSCIKKLSELPVNAGTYYVRATVAADDNYEAATSNIAKLIIKRAKITDASLKNTTYVYNGKTQKPSVIVKNSKGKKLKSSDYSVAYSKGCKIVGTYTVKITLKGNYSGKITKNYKIVPKGTSVSKIVAKSKGFTISWKKQTTQSTGYQIQYSTNSKFTSAKTLSVSKNKTVSKTVTKLKGKKKYYVRVRTYKSIEGKKYYSSWSKVKNITTKK